MSLRLDSIRAFDLPVEPRPIVRVPEGSRLIGLTVTRPAYLGGSVDCAAVYAQVPVASDSEVGWRFRLVREGERFDDWEQPWHSLGLLTVGGATYAAFIRSFEG